MNAPLVEVLGMRRVAVRRQTDSNYGQEIRYQHHWNKDDTTESVFTITVSDQFYNDDSSEELVVSIDMDFKVISPEKILHDYLDPVLRHKHAIPLIARLTYEAQNVLRGETIKEMKDTSFSVSIPERNLNDTIQIVMDKLPKRDTSKLPITLNRDESVANYVIKMFAIVREAISKRKIIIQGKGFSLEDKVLDEIYQLDGDWEALSSKIIFDFLSNDSMNILQLTDEESRLFRKCSHLAYYYEGERRSRGEHADERFLKIHEKYFR